MSPTCRVVATSDKEVVYVKSSFDRTLGRFCPQGYEIFDNCANGGIIVSRSGRRFTKDSWSQFRSAVKEHYDFDVPEDSFDLSLLPESL